MLSDPPVEQERPRAEIQTGTDPYRPPHLLSLICAFPCIKSCNVNWYNFLPELGTRQHCRDNVTMFDGLKTVDFDST